MDTKHNTEHTVESLVRAYLEHAAGYYGASREAGNLRATLGRLVAFAGEIPADQFRALRLQAWRARLIGEGLSRGYVNRAVRHARRCWRWGVSMELVDPDALESLSSLSGLRRGRTDADEPPAVGPVDPQLVLATLPHLTPKVAAIVELLRLTGARTGEIRTMRCGEIDMGREVWLYRPSEHKTAYRGKTRVIPLDEPCQRVLVPWLVPWLRPFMPEALVFESRGGEPYAESSIRNAVARACVRAGIRHWHPHQIRHLVLTEARGALGGDVHALQGLAGHARLSTTEIYARTEADAAVRAQKALREAGRKAATT